MNDQITIEVVKGGFILSYAENNLYEREVFTSPRKLNSKIKEVLEKLSYVPADSE